MNGFSIVDIIVFIVYCLTIVFAGIYVSRTKKGVKKTAKDYFLAGKSLPWWAIGASLIASNISAEQFIGMSGSGYAMGLGIATYEWMAAITLLVVGKFFLPIFLKKQIYTMPQFLEQRYDSRVRTILAVFWLLVYVFVNLTAVLYLGALMIQTIVGSPTVMIMGTEVSVFVLAILFLIAFAIVYSIYGGLAAVAWTDVIQVLFLIVGGVIVLVLSINAISPDGSFLSGFDVMYTTAKDKFDMIFNPSSPHYADLPGISVLIGGMWIANLYYWGCNQYITQRALAAKNIKQAQKGVMFAAFLKILMPLIVVVPGIAAFVLENKGIAGIHVMTPDQAYPSMFKAFVPIGLKGATFAALTAAIVSSLSSMMNSTATIFTMDIYRNYIKPSANDDELVRIGRIVSFIAIAIAAFIAPALQNFYQVFQFIQEYTGLVSPGIFVIFIYGLFWRKSTSNAAFWVAILTFPLSFGLKLAFPEMPFIDRMGVVFLVLSLLMMGVSLYETKEIKFSHTLFVKLGFHFMVLFIIIVFYTIIMLEGYGINSTVVKFTYHLIIYQMMIVIFTMLAPLKNDVRSITISSRLFRTEYAFNLGSTIAIIIIVCLYAIFW